MEQYRVPIPTASYAKSLIQIPQTIFLPPDPASHSFWNKLENSIFGSHPLRPSPKFAISSFLGIKAAQFINIAYAYV